MRALVIAAAAVCLMASAPAQAHPDSGWMGPGNRMAGFVKRSPHSANQKRRSVNLDRVSRPAKFSQRAKYRSSNGTAKSDMPAARIVAHPAGCPASRFCGCGVAVHLFGRPVRDLYLAAAWLRFPRAAPGPGMVAARPGHVFAILRVISAGRVLAFDPNSGGHQTRVHVRSLAGFAVVNPRSRLARAGGAG